MAKKSTKKSTKKAKNQITIGQVLADPLSQNAQQLRRVLLDHLADSCPAWLWDARNGDLVWQNDAAKMYSSKRAGKKGKSTTSDAMKGQLRRILDITPVGQSTLSRLHFSKGKKPFDRICRCTPIQLAAEKSEQTQIGILSVSVDPVGIFDKVEPDNLFTTAQSLGFAGAIVRKGGVVVEQSERFGELIGAEFDSELIVGLSGAARHGTPIAVESEDGRREFRIVRIAGKDKTYLALIDLRKAPEPEPEEHTPAQLFNGDDIALPDGEPLRASVSGGPLSTLIDQLSGLAPATPDAGQQETETASEVSADEDIASNLDQIALSAPVDLAETGTVIAQNNDDLAFEELLDEDVIVSDAPTIDEPQSDLESDLTERDRYNFNEVSRILQHRLAKDSSARGHNLRTLAGGVHTGSDIGKLTALVDSMAAASLGESAHDQVSDDEIAQVAAISLNQDHLILNRLPLGILIYRDQDMLFANRAMVNLLGYDSVEKLRQRGIAAVIPESKGSAEIGPLTQLVNRDGETIDVITRLQTAKWLGHPCFMITAQILEFDPAKPSPTADNDQKSASTASFIDEVALELRTPLNSISGFGEMLQMQEFGALGHLRYTEYAGDIVTAALHATTIVNEASELSRLSAGHGEYERQNINLHNLLERAIGMVRKQANSAQIVIRENIAEHLPTVEGDAGVAAKIILNLLANAINVAPDGGQIILTADQSDTKESVDIHIRHSGGNDSQVALRKGFTLYYPQGFTATPRAKLENVSPDDEDAPATNALPASGFGLKIVQALADANGITLDLRTLSDQDSLMEITIPQKRK